MGFFWLSYCLAYNGGNTGGAVLGQVLHPHHLLPLHHGAVRQLEYVWSNCCFCQDSILLGQWDSCSTHQHWPVWLPSLCGAFYLSALQKSQVVCYTWLLHDHGRSLAKMHPLGLPLHTPPALHHHLLPVSLLHIYRWAYSYVSPSSAHSLLVSTQGKEHSYFSWTALKCSRSGAFLYIWVKSCIRTCRIFWDRL